MELKIEQRLLILNVLPGAGNITTLRIVRELQDNLSFTEKELKVNFLRQEGSQLVWGDPEKEGRDLAEVDQPKEVPIGEKAFDVIKESLSKVEQAGKLEARYVPFYEHFVEGKEWNASS